MLEILCSQLQLKGLAEVRFSAISEGAQAPRHLVALMFILHSTVQTMWHFDLVSSQ